MSSGQEPASAGRKVVTRWEARSVLFFARFLVVVSFKSDGVVFLCQVGRSENKGVSARPNALPRRASAFATGLVGSLSSSPAPHVRDRFRAAQ